MNEIPETHHMKQDQVDQRMEFYPREALRLRSQAGLQVLPRTSPMTDCL